MREAGIVVQEVGFTREMRWADPQTREVREINGNLNTFDLAPTFDAASPRYQLAVTVAQFADLLRHSPWADPGSLSAVADQAKRLAQTGLASDPDVARFANLVSQTLNLGVSNSAISSSRPVRGAAPAKNL